MSCKRIILSTLSISGYYENTYSVLLEVSCNKIKNERKRKLLGLIINRVCMTGDELCVKISRFISNLITSQKFNLIRIERIEVGAECDGFSKNQ